MQTRRACIFLISMQMILLISTRAQEVDKRVPQGFLGMRGKKFVASTEMEQFYKRKPQFFVGVKGKKHINDLYENNDLYYKRVPMGFVGMRGKKEYLQDPVFADNYRYMPRTGSLIGQIDYSTNEDFRSPNDDVSIINEFLTNYLTQHKYSDSDTNDSQGGSPVIEDTLDERITDDVEKRANMHQFYGVRGKKFAGQDKIDLAFRGKFIAVRGKKAVKATDPQELRFLLGQNEPWPKKRTQMGFFGMRGKKWTDDSSSETDKTN